MMAAVEQTLATEAATVAGVAEEAAAAVAASGVEGREYSCFRAGNRFAERVEVLSFGGR